MGIRKLIEKLQSSRAGDFAINFALVIVFTLSLSWLLDYDPYSLIEGTTDFNSGDYYDRLYHENSTLPMDRDMVIVASDKIPNERLADVLRTIDGYGAKAIGFDLIFRNESSLTDELIDVIDSLPQIVMPIELDYNNETGTVSRGEPSLIDDYLDGKREATVSFPPRGVMSFQRDVYLTVIPEDGESIESLALALAKMKRPELKGEGETEAINFNISDVEVIGYEELMDPDLKETVASLIKDKIVLVGDVENKYDVHPTAVDENMPGIKVHAAAIATLINDKPVKPLGRVWSVLFMIVCVAVVTAADSYFSDKDDFRKGLAFLGIKGFFLALMLVGGYILYVRCGIRSDFTYSITLFMFSMVIADLWFGFRNYLADRRERKNENR